MSEYLAMRNVDISNPLNSMLRSTAAFLPRAIAFIVILIVGYLLARLLRTAVDKLLERVGFDRLVERGGLKTALARSRYDASGIVGQLVFYAVLLITLRIAFDVWGPNAVSTLITAVIAWLPRLFVAILIVVVAAAIASAVRDIVSNTLGDSPTAAPWRTSPPCSSSVSASSPRSTRSEWRPLSRPRS